MAYNVKVHDVVIAAPSKLCQCLQYIPRHISVILISLITVMNEYNSMLSLSRNNLGQLTRKGTVQQPGAKKLTSINCRGATISEWSLSVCDNTRVRLKTADNDKSLKSERPYRNISIPVMFFYEEPEPV